jgi:hypothetical protein
MSFSIAMNITNKHRSRASMDAPQSLLRHMLAALCAWMMATGCAFGQDNKIGPADGGEIASAFASQTVRLTAKPGNTAITAEWSYTNRWDFPLVVEKFDTSCGCLSGKHDQPTLAPGKTGKLTASFVAGQQRGLIRKSLHVKFIGHDKPVELVVEASVPSHVELSSHELVWKAAGASEAKTIDITSGTGQPFTITGLLGLADGHYTDTTETLSAGAHFRLHITPTASSSGQHCLQVSTASTNSRDSVLAVFLCVLQAKL